MWCSALVVLAMVVWSWDMSCVHTAHVPAPHAVVHGLALLMMGIMMCETCWDRCWIINIRLVASCWFLSLHPTFMTHGHKSLKESSRFTHDNVPNGEQFMAVQRTVVLLSTGSSSPKSIFFFKMSVVFIIWHSITAQKFEFSDSLYAAQYPWNKKLWRILDKCYLHAMQSSLVDGQQVPLKCWYLSIN